MCITKYVFPAIVRKDVTQCAIPAFVSTLNGRNNEGST